MFHTNLVRYMRIKEKTPKDFYNNKDPRLNISRRQFFRLKSGEDTPTVNTILKMAKVLGVNPNELTKQEPKDATESFEEAARKGVKLADCEKRPDELEKAYSAIDTIREQRDAALKGWTEANHIARSANDLAKRAHETTRRFFAIYFALGMFFGATALMLIVALLS